MTVRKTYRAKWLVSDPWTVHENGYVQVANGVIEHIGTGKPPMADGVVDLGAGALMPPCVNAHTHLELSAFQGTVPFDSGFRHWVRKLLEQRGALSENSLRAAAARAIDVLKEGECRIIGDVSTLGLTKELLETSSLSGIFFMEHLGDCLPASFNVEKSEAFSTSLAAHAPHTSSPDLIRQIKHATRDKGLPMSIHLSESEDEFLFITTGRGPWADFLSERNMDFSTWPLPAKSPVSYLYHLGVLDARTIAVHMIHCSGEDMALLKKAGSTICFCPRSNFLLHGRLPDIPSFLALGFKPCLGTDSLASSPSLSILDEMAFISSRYSSVSPSDILAMGTLYGAIALGMEKRSGRLAPGYDAPFYVPAAAEKTREVVQAIVTMGNDDLECIKKMEER